jgi:OsmC subfamily peroxiredoxin
MTARNGSAEWHGSAESGSGTITVRNGVFGGAYSYESRFGEAAGINPEQLLAAAHSGCLTMALANALSAAGHQPESLRTNARVQLRNREGARPRNRGRRARHRRAAVPELRRSGKKGLSRFARGGCDPRDHLDREAAHCRPRRRTGAERPMSTNDQRAVRSGRTRAVSWAVARRSQRLRLVLEYLRSHDLLAKPASASGDREARISA